MTYALLIHTPKVVDHETPDGELSDVLARHRALQAELKEAGRFGAAVRLDDKHSASTVRAADGDFVVSEGPYMETREWLVGFYLIDAETLEEAQAAAARICPPDGSIEVRPVAWSSS